jgi:DHA2 family multidrug resistance protein-like MFS transporter
MMAVYAIARSSIAWYSGRWSDRIDSTLLTIPGLIVFMGSVAAISWLVSSSPISVLTATLAAAGLGFGCFIPPNNSTLMWSVPQELYGFGAAMMATSRTLGMAVGVALDGALLSNRSRSLVNSAALAFRLSALLALAAAITNALAAVPGRRGSAEAVLSEH